MLKTEWGSFAVGGEDVIEKSARECAYDYYERHDIPRDKIKILDIKYHFEDDSAFFYQALIQYDDTQITKEELNWVGIGTED